MGIEYHGNEKVLPLPTELPEVGLGGRATLDVLAPSVLGKATALGDVIALAHMDPPTPWITWATTLWNASVNQNLLHPATAPVAREIEQRVVEWIARAPQGCDAPCRSGRTSSHDTDRRDTAHQLRVIHLALVRFLGQPSRVRAPCRDGRRDLDTPPPGHRAAPPPASHRRVAPASAHRSVHPSYRPDATLASAHAPAPPARAPRAPRRP